MTLNTNILTRGIHFKDCLVCLIVYKNNFRFVIIIRNSFIFCILLFLKVKTWRGKYIYIIKIIF